MRSPCPEIGMAGTEPGHYVRKDGCDYVGMAETEPGHYVRKDGCDYFSSTTVLSTRLTVILSVPTPKILSFLVSLAVCSRLAPG